MNLDEQAMVDGLLMTTTTTTMIIKGIKSSSFYLNNALLCAGEVHEQVSCDRLSDVLTAGTSCSVLWSPMGVGCRATTGEKAPCVRVRAWLQMQCTACALYTALGLSDRWLHRPTLGALLRRRGIALHYVSAAYWRKGQ